MNVGFYIDKLIALGVGIIFLFIHFKDKEGKELKNKALLFKVAGVIIIVFSIVLLFWHPES